MDKDSGIFYEFSRTPSPARQLLIGKICFNVLLSVIGSLLAVGVGVLAMNASIRWDLLPLTVAVIMVTTAGWFFMFSMFAVRLRRMDAFNTFYQRGLHHPDVHQHDVLSDQRAAAWFRMGGQLNPMTWQVDLLRFSLLGTGAPAVVFAEGVAFVVFTVAGLAVAVRTIDRAG